MDNVLTYFARHGSTDLNQANCFRGDADPPLSAKGFREASQLAHYMQPIDVSFIVASAKQRAVQTADVINVSKKLQGKNLQVVPNETLFAWSVGNFSGKPKNKENLDKLQEYIDSPDIIVPGGESLSNFRSRVRPLIYEAIDESDKQGLPGLAVVHSSVIHELGIMFHSDHTIALVKPGGLTAVYVSNGTLRVQAVFRPELGYHSEAS